MKIFEYMNKYDYENVFICNDNATGLKALTSPRLKGRGFPSIDSELHIAYEGQSRGSENPFHLN